MENETHEAEGCKIKISINLQNQQKDNETFEKPPEKLFKEYEIEHNKEESYFTRTGFLLAFSGILFTKLFENVNLVHLWKLANDVENGNGRFCQILSFLFALAALISCVFSMFSAIMTIYPYEYNDIPKNDYKDNDFAYRVKTKKDRNTRKAGWYKKALEAFFVSVLLMLLYKITLEI
ncbi:MAG: hypothetical protein ACI4CX_05255 [Candidatus Weimeria sp.]